MPTLVAQPHAHSRCRPPSQKLIDEFIGQVNTKTSRVSVAHIAPVPQGLGRAPDRLRSFDEFTIVAERHPAGKAQGRRTGCPPAGQAVNQAPPLARGGFQYFHFPPKAGPNTSRYAWPAVRNGNRYTATPQGKSSS